MVADISTTRILILDDPFILKLLACMLAVRGFLSADCYQGKKRDATLYYSFSSASSLRDVVRYLGKYSSA